LELPSGLRMLASLAFVAFTTRLNATPTVPH